MAVGELGRTVLEIVADDSKLYQGIAAAERAAKDLGAAFDRVSKDIKTDVGSVSAATDAFGTSVRSAFGTLEAGSRTVSSAMQQLATSTKPLQQETRNLGGFMGDLTSQAKAVALGFLGAQAVMAGFSAAFGAARLAVNATVGTLSDAVTHAADLGDELFAMSQKTGVTVESLSALKFVAGQTNTSLETISGAVFRLETNLGSGAKKTAEAVATLGLSLSDLKKQAPEDAFATILAKIGELPSATQRAATGVAIFGKSFKDVAQLSQEDLPALITQARELGLVLSTEVAVAGDRLNDEFGVLRGTLEGLELQLGARLLPAVVAFAESFGGVFQAAASAAVTSTEKTGDGFDTFVVHLGETLAGGIEQLARFADAVVSWEQDVLKSLAEFAKADAAILGPVVSIARALDAALAGGEFAVPLKAAEKAVDALKGLGTVSDSIASAGPKIREIAQAVEKAAANVREGFGDNFTRIQKEIADAADGMRAKLGAVGDGAAEGADKAGEAFKSFGKQLGDLTSQIDRAVANGADLPTLLKLFGDEAAKSAQKAQAWGIAVADSVGYVAAEFNQAALATTFGKLNDQLQKFFDARTQQQFKRLQADMHEGAQAWIEWNKDGTGTLDKLNESFDDFFQKRWEAKFKALADQISKDTERQISGMQRLRQVLGLVAADASSSFGQIASLAGDNAVGHAFAGVANIAGAMDQAGKAASNWAAANKNLEGTAQAAAKAVAGLQGAAAIYQATSSGSWAQRAAGGLLSGAQFGAAFGPGGAAAGAFAGLAAGVVLGGIQAVQADKQRKAQMAAFADQLRQAIDQRYGNVDNLTTLGHAFGYDIRARGLATEDSVRQIDALNADMDRLNAATDHYHIQLSQLGETLRNQRLGDWSRDLLDNARVLGAAGVDAGTIVNGMSDDLNGYIEQALRSGTQIPAAMRPLIESLIRQGDLTDRNRRLMEGLEDTSVPSLSDIKGAAERYGIELDKLGPKVDQLRIDEIAPQLISDWTILSSLGGDTNEILSKMAPSIQNVIDMARRSGSQIPAAMKPIIDAMAKQGLLTDENGQALKDLSTLNFAEPIEQSVDRLISAMDRFIAKLIGDSGSVLSSMTALERGVTIPIRYQLDGTPEPDAVPVLQNVPGHTGPLSPTSDDSTPQAVPRPGSNIWNPMGQVITFPDGSTRVLGDSTATNPERRYVQYFEDGGVVKDAQSAAAGWQHWATTGGTVAEDDERGRPVPLTARLQWRCVA